MAYGGGVTKKRAESAALCVYDTFLGKLKKRRSTSEIWTANIRLAVTQMTAHMQRLTADLASMTFGTP